MVFMQFTIFKDRIHDLCVARRLILGLDDNVDDVFFMGCLPPGFKNDGVEIGGYSRAMYLKAYIFDVFF